MALVTKTMSERQNHLSAIAAPVTPSQENYEGRATLTKGFSLPLVSVVITNYNYGRRLRDAVESVQAQSYPNIECVIVDDASTDDSPTILAALESEFSDIKIISRETNAGQIAAFCDGFAASAGDYVIFLDADDVLLPAAVETHAYVHLSARVPVGLTTSDMMRAVNGRLVQGCDREIGSYVRSGRGRRDNLLREFGLTAPDLWAFDHLLTNDIAKRVHLLEGIGWDEWVYSPTSGNCFRRDALLIALDPHVLAGLKINADTYLNRFVCLLNGGILIDIPLSVYHIHTTNAFVSRAQLFGATNFNKEKEMAANLTAWKAAVGVLIDDAGRLYARMDFLHYSHVLEVLASASIYAKANSDHDVGLGADCAADYVLDRLSANEPALRALIGREHFSSLRRSIKGVHIAGGAQPRSWWRRRFAEFLLTFGRLTHSNWLTLQGEQVWRG